MSYWNHRVLQSKDGHGEEYYTIREVHYNDDGTIYAYSKDPRPAYGDTIEELRETLQWMLDCLDKPVLIEGEVKFVDYDE